MTETPIPTSPAPSTPGAPSRRTVLAGGTALVGTLAWPTSAAARAATPAALLAPRRRPPGDPFTLGVASGDPTPDGVVLWTRLALDPDAADGFGGMGFRPVDVRYQVATDPRFRRIVRTGTATARPEHAHAIHVVLRGLEPGREYFYRFRAGSAVSAVGLTRTTPSPRSYGSPLTMAFASCAQYEHGWFTAYRRLAEDAPDLVLHLGDYFYEYEADTYVAATGNVRDHGGPETTTLAGYRQRHAQYKADLDLQAAHAAAPWVVVWDDHELDNNWADEVPEDDQTRALFLQRRAAAFQAYYENMPLRPTSRPRGIDLQLYRRVRWGRLATFHMLDTRQYRSDQACGDQASIGCEERLDPARSITGEEQEQWLLDGLGRSAATWDVLGQQVFFAQRDFEQGPLERVSMDGWDGYVASRERILSGIAQLDVANPVVLTGDVHVHYANDLKADFADPDSATVGVELVATSVTSGGDGAQVPTNAETLLGENPHIRYVNSRRGYVRTRFTRDELRADFRTVPYVSQPDAPVSTDASFVVAAGEPGLQRVSPVD